MQRQHAKLPRRKEWGWSALLRLAQPQPRSCNHLHVTTSRFFEKRGELRKSSLGALKIQVQHF